MSFKRGSKSPRQQERPRLQIDGMVLRGLHPTDVDKFYAAINAIVEKRRGPVVKIK